MSKQFLVSEQGIWCDIGAMWSSKNSVYKFIDAVNAINISKDILKDATSGIDDDIEFSYTVEDAEDIFYNWQIIEKFVNGIHYEATEIIDIPFAQGMNNVLQALYELNPKDFRTKKDFLFFKCGYSIQELLIDAVEVEELKSSYNSLIEDLDCDEMEDSFIETFKTANYWDEQFVEMNQISQIAENYLVSYSGEWETYSSDEKLLILNQYALDISEVMEEEGKYGIGDNSIIVSVKWNVDDPNYDPQSNAFAYTYASSRDGIIYLNEEARTNTDLYNMSFLLETVTHEARHQYQGHAKYEPEQYSLPTNLGNDWLNDYNIKYWERPWEIDARGYAAISQGY